MPSQNVVLLLLISFLTSHTRGLNWMKSDNSSICTCMFKYGVSCTIAESVDIELRKTIPCHKLTTEIVSLSINCSKSRGTVTIIMKQLISSFPNLQNLTVSGCLIDTSSYHVARENCSIHTSTELRPNIGEDSDFRLNFNAKLCCKCKQPSRHPLCILNHLAINNANLQQVPIGFLSSCGNLFSVDLEYNDLTMLDNFDFVALVSLEKLTRLKLASNYLTALSISFTETLLNEIRHFMTDSLPGWINKNNATLTLQQYKGFHSLEKIFRRWLNSSESFTFKHFVAIMEKVNLTLKFDLNKSKLESLNLYGNLFNYFPLELLGLGSIRSLNLAYNSIKDVFTAGESYALYSISNTLSELKMQGNRIKEIQEKSFNFLNNVQVFNLSDNQIHHFSSEAWVSPDNKLSRFYVDRNRIFKIHFSVVMHRLMILSATHNQIKSIDLNLTNFTPKIMHFHLSNNPFQEVKHNSLQNLPLLYQLDLSYGNLTEMPSKSYRVAHKVSDSSRTIVDIRHNKETINCDCNSVFSAIQDQAHYNGLYTYPRITWSRDQKCVMGKDQSEVLLSMKSLKFYCYFKGGYCLPGCECCEDYHCRCKWHCPSPCNCHYKNAESGRLVTVDCANKRLGYFPRITLRNASILLFNNNKLVNLPPQAFPPSMDTLYSIHLSNNQIPMIGPGSFQNLVNLHFLNISNNKIKAINKLAFKGLSKTEWIVLSNNHLKHFDADVFRSLPMLGRLNLRNNPLRCDCALLPDFLDFMRRGGASGYLDVGLPADCSVSAELKRYGGVKTHRLAVVQVRSVCRKVAENKRAEHARHRWYLILGLSVASALLVVVVVAAAGYHYRYAIRFVLDARVNSGLARTLLSLPNYSQRAGIDVGFLVHERQTEQFYAVRRRLVGTPREALNIIRLADHMPGATRLGQVASLMDDMAVCVILLSADFLADALFAEALRILLVRNVERSPSQPRLTLVPVLLEAAVREAPEWPQFELLLRHYPLLRWDQPFFWERLVTSLPPPPPESARQQRQQQRRRAGGDVDEEQCGDRTPLIGPRPADAASLNHLCIIAHENQAASHVRQLFDHYRARVNMCHARHRHVYGSVDELGAIEQLSLNRLLGSCLQVVVVVSMEFLNDAWTQQEVIQSLTARLHSLPFRGTIILLEIGPSFAHLCQEPAFRFYDQLRHEALVVTLAWPDVERNWDILNANLLPETIAAGDSLSAGAMGMDEEEFTRCLMRPVTELTASPQPGCNIFEQNCQRWS